MFPTLSYIVRWCTGWNVFLPIPTFGFFMALSFWAAYLVFSLELRRKQRMGVPTTAACSGAAGGARSGVDGGGGPVPAGINIGRLMDRLLLWCGLIGFGGALLFAKLDDTYGLVHHPWQWLTRYQGLTYFGGFLFGAITYLVMLRRRGISLAVAVDIGSPGMLLAYAIGRLGCHLAGDGDWGIPVRWAKPAWLSRAPDWLWSAHYPHNVLRQGVYLPGCSGGYCTVLPQGVFPTSFYEFAVCLLLFFVLWGLRRRLKTPGLLFCIYALLVGVERFLIEYIRITPRHAFFGWVLTQAQWISLGFILLAIMGISYILTSSAKKAYFYL